MNNMRKLIVKLFALNYIVVLFGKSISFPRAANMIVPALCLATVFDSYITLLLLIITVSIPFVYFHLYSVKYNELDKSQKLQYENASSKYADLYRETIKFKNVHLLLINPVAVIATIIYLL